MNQIDEHYVKEFKYNVRYYSVWVGTLVTDKDPSVLFSCMLTSTFLRITAE